MKKLKIKFLILALSSFVSTSQVINEKQSPLLKTFGFIHGQHSTLNNIKLNFPSLNIDATTAELEFNKNYNEALSKIYYAVKNIYGDRFKDHLTSVKNSSEKYYKLKKMSKENAILFIEKVKNRSKGIINSPYLETLLKYQYIDNPIDEFTANYNIHSVKSYSNSRKVELSVKIPMSWKEIDGIFPAVLKKFRSDYGTGNEIITIIIDKLNSSLKMNDLFTKKELLKEVPKGGKIISSYSKNIDTKLTGIVEYEEINPNTSSNQKRVVIQYVQIYQNSVLRINCATYGAVTEDFDLRIKKFKPLYLTILKSIDLNNLAKKNNTIANKI